MLFIEFPDMILIERNEIGLLYYINKLPVYSFEKGEIINPILAVNNKFILNIDQRFVKLFGLDIRIIDNIEDINKIVNDINDKALYLVCCMFNLYTMTGDRKLFERMSNNFMEKLKTYQYKFIYSKSNNKSNNKLNNQSCDISNVNYITTLPLEDYNFNFDFENSPRINQSLHNFIHNKLGKPF
jgi:hypothetical protein